MERNRTDLQDLFRVTHLFTSHIHEYFSGVWEGVPYTTTGGSGARLQGSDPQHFFHHYVKVRVNDGKVNLTIRRITAENVTVSLYALFEHYVIEEGLLLCAVICMLTSLLSVRRKTGSRERGVSRNA